MARIPWGMLYVGVVGYATLTSSFLTFLILSVALTALRILHATHLYPAFLTPIKHIPTPPVSFIDCPYLRSYNSPVLTETETIMDQGQ
jgi:hypothetical protein